MRVEFVQKTAAALPTARIRRALEAAARHFDLPENCEVSVCSVGDRMIQKLNAKHRGKPYVADVLSFPQFDQKNAVKAIQRAARTEPVVPVGDMIMNQKKLTADAPFYGRQANEHIEAMSIHSFLHLLGYDHKRPQDARRMERLERILLHHV